MSRLVLYPNDAPPLEVVRPGVNTGYVMAGPIDFGNADYAYRESGNRGTQGARIAQANLPNRNSVIPIRCYGASVDDLLVKATTLLDAIDALRQREGLVLWQPGAGSYRQWFDVKAAGARPANWDTPSELRYRHDLAVGLVAGPYLLGDPMDTRDELDQPTILASDWTIDAGAPAVINGKLAPQTTGLKRLRHTVKGYGSRYGSVRVSARFETGATITGGIYGVQARATLGVAGAADTNITAEIVAGTNLLRISQYVAGVQTTLGSVAFTPLASTSYWVVLRIDGCYASAEVWTKPPLSNVFMVLDAAIPAQVTDVIVPSDFNVGDVGIRWTASLTTERVSEFRLEANAVGFPGFETNIPTSRLRCIGIPGDAPALAYFKAEIPDQPVSITPRWAMLGYSERPLTYNMITNGDFEQSAAGTSGWTNAAVTGVTALATSVARDATKRRWGVASMTVVAPATANAGASYRLPLLSSRGVVYAIWGWLWATTGTVTAQLVLGGPAAGTVATTPNVALSATPRFCAVGVRNFRQGFALHVGARITAATAQTFQADGLGAAEVPDLQLSAAINSSVATITLKPHAWDLQAVPLPFRAFVNTEVMQVNAVSSDNRTLTVDRGLDGTTQASASIGDLFCILPSEPHYEGRGALPPTAYIAGETFLSGLSNDSTGITATAGTGATWAPGSALTRDLVYMVDPTLIPSDPYLNGELLTEVWAAVRMSAFGSAVSVVASVEPEYGILRGQARYTGEFTTSGAKLQAPSSGTRYRFCRLGIISFRADRARPQRCRLRVTISVPAAGTFDLNSLLLVPARTRSALPTRKSPNASYPNWLPAGSLEAGIATAKVLEPDGLAASIYSPDAYGFPYPDAGLGRVLELPPGDSEFMLRVASAIPDEEVATTSDDAGVNSLTFYSASMQANVIPRYLLGRGS